MKASQIGIQIAREMPSDADNLATAWLLRGGYIFRHAAGVFAFTGLMNRVKRKVSQIIEEEITRAGGCEITLPILQSADIWKQTGRWAIYEHDKLMFRLEDRKGRLFGLSPTAEEAACELAKHLIRGHSQLPLILFQQNTKFRDELRPRSGLLRGREFIMMDAYSFDIDEEGLDTAYRKMSAAYHAILRRIGLNYIVVQADSGAIGGTASEEFMAISDIGEDTLLYSDGYAANLERATSHPPKAEGYANGPMRIIETVGTTTIEEVARLLSTEPSAVIKTLIVDLFYSDRVENAAILIRGDCDVNLIKLANHAKAMEARPSEREVVEALCGCPPGYVGPVNLPSGLRMVADISLEGIASFVSGCCQVDKHAVSVMPGRDFTTPEMVDLRLAREGEIGPAGEPLHQCRGIEVGHVFKLGTKYSAAMNAGVTDANQTFRPFQMGCYGIGTTRLLSTIVDQNCSEKQGLRWPMAVAPFHIHVLPFKPEYLIAAEDIVRRFEERGVECLLDDRKGTPGVKLKDSDIIGLPLRLVIGRDFTEGYVEVYDRLRDSASKQHVDEVIDTLSAIVHDEIRKSFT